MIMESVVEREFNWDDEIENDGQEYVLLRKGTIDLK